MFQWATCSTPGRTGQRSSASEQTVTNQWNGSSRNSSMDFA